ncbi:amino acid/polyamine transporter I [Radiomyces spectabilis]|uniref:amino acid/polyamine transporter I n=1 Tax=Radiomyces spectabilis TaxID=64574 RepID=UPI00221EAE9E|nr:amino acid/polyamine transporter I [Radiomyces spectabilis]KAI8384321.1 amino acid/polyamine transporter I [Radiomyces spectabilis]
MTWGWVGVSFFTLMVGLAMAEIASAYPTSGGLYWWAARLSSPRYAPFASWMTGWFNLIGQFAVTAGVDYGIALMLGATISVATHGAWIPSTGATVGLHVLICFTHGVANSLGPTVMRWINSISTWWQVIAPTVLICTIAATAPIHQSSAFVFTHYNNNTGWSSPAYVVLIGLLQAQFTFTGYDASAHMAEETQNAAVSGPVGMIMAIVVSAIVGWGFIIGFLFCIQDLQTTIETTTNFPVMQIIVDCAGPTPAVVLMVILMLACWFCGFATVTSNSRMIYAFSRDGAMPGSRWWHLIDKKRQTPLNAVWLSVIVASLLGLLSVGNATAFSAITSIATIGSYLSYGMPIITKLLNEKQFVRGPLHLGSFSSPIGWVALAWILFITVLFVLPPKAPVTAINMNYTCVAVGAVLIGAGLGYALYARHWFTGPRINLSSEDRSSVHQIERDSFPEIYPSDGISTAESDSKPYAD